MGEFATGAVIILATIAFMASIALILIDTIRTGLDPDHRSILDHERAMNALDPEDDHG